MEKNLEKLTKKELINTISKMSKKNIIKMLINQSGGISEGNVYPSEIITEPIVFNPAIAQKKNNVMRNNKIYEGVTDYKIT